MHKPPLAAHIFRLSLLEALRNRLGLILFFAIPVIFLGIVVMTAGKTLVPIKIFFFHDTLQLLLSQKDVSLVFVSASVSGFLSAYFALVLFHQDFEYYRYCVFSGLRPMSFLGGRFVFFGAMAVVLAAGITLVLGRLVPLHNSMLVFCGFLLVALLYGTFGGIAGSMTKEFLIAVLCVALLADIDAAWLQNPVYYTAAERLEFIRWLPAYYPCQLIFSAAFTERNNSLALCGGTIYGIVLFGILLFILTMRMRGVFRKNLKEKQLVSKRKEG
jgi:hypothetical protein